MVLINITLGKFIIITGVAIVVSLISIISGLYYLVKAIYMSKISKNYKKVRHYFMTAFIYALFIPIIILIGLHSFLAPLVSFTETSTVVNPGMVSAAEIVYERSPLQVYIFLLALGAILYWIYDGRKIRKKEKESIHQ